MYEVTINGSANRLIFLSEGLNEMCNMYGSRSQLITLYYGFVMRYWLTVYAVQTFNIKNVLYDIKYRLSSIDCDGRRGSNPSPDVETMV